MPGPAPRPRRRPRAPLNVLARRCPGRDFPAPTVFSQNVYLRSTDRRGSRDFGGVRRAREGGRRKCGVAWESLCPSARPPGGACLARPSVSRPAGVSCSPVGRPRPRLVQSGSIRPVSGSRRALRSPPPRSRTGVCGLCVQHEAGGPLRPRGRLLHVGTGERARPTDGRAEGTRLCVMAASRIQEDVSRSHVGASPRPVDASERVVSHDASGRGFCLFEAWASRQAPLRQDG